MRKEKVRVKMRSKKEIRETIRFCETEARETIAQLPKEVRETQSMVNDTIIYWLKWVLGEEPNVLSAMDKDLDQILELSKKVKKHE